MLNLHTYKYVNYFLCINKSQPLLWQHILSKFQVDDDVLPLLRNITAFEMTLNIGYGDAK